MDRCLSIPLNGFVNVDEDLVYNVINWLSIPLNGFFIDFNIMVTYVEFISSFQFH